MKKIEIDEMKELQLNILADIAQFCEKNNLRYFLSGGSMLGAVRHHGFIPWDDDIDINMPRPDYNRFIHEYQHPYYDVCCWDLDKNYLCTFAKVSDKRTILEENGKFGRKVGVNVDIFPVDGLPKGDINVNRTVSRMKALWGLVVCATVIDITKRSTIKKIEITLMRAFYKLFPLQSYFTGLAIKTAQKYPFDNSNKVAVLVWGYGKKEVIMRSTAEEYIESDFENYKFYIPRNYDEYLRNLYGDYMKLPPENERIYKHGSNAFWTINNQE